MDCIREHLSESKRKSRNLSEKKRRDAFNSLVTELSVLVTGVERRLDKSNILKQTIAFLKKHNQLQTDCATNEEIDQNRPSFLTADEYFRLLLDSMNAFVFVVEIGRDGETAVINFVSENAGTRFGGSGFINDAIRGKSLFDLVDQDHESLVRASLRNKAMESNAEKSETASSTEFLRFNCTIGGIGKDEAIKASVTARFKILEGASSLSCVCLAKLLYGPTWSDGIITIPDTKLGGIHEFSLRMDVEWRFIHVDQNVMYILGYEPMDMLGTSGYDYCHPDDLEKLMESHERLKTNTDGVTDPYRIRTKCGMYIWIRTRFYVTYCEWDSTPEFIVCTNTVQNSPNVATNNGELTADKSIGQMNTTGWTLPDAESNASKREQHSNRQIFRPQPGVSIEHTPLSRSSLVSRPPPAKKPKGVNASPSVLPAEDSTQSMDQLNERMLWELLEKRQSNLQEKIVQHEEELKRLQDQLFTAVPLLSSASPVSSIGTVEMDISSPASSSLSPANASSLISRLQNGVWTNQQQFGNCVWTSTIGNPSTQDAFFDNTRSNGSFNF